MGVVVLKVLGKDQEMSSQGGTMWYQSGLLRDLLGWLLGHGLERGLTPPATCAPTRW